MKQILALNLCDRLQYTPTKYAHGFGHWVIGEYLLLFQGCDATIGTPVPAK